MAPDPLVYYDTNDDFKDMRFEIIRKVVGQFGVAPRKNGAILTPSV